MFGGLLKSTRKRVIRYTILALNVLIVLAVALFILHSPNTSETVSQSSAFLASDSKVVDPLDQLSSADIAVNVARITNLAEATSATNQADSVNALLSVSPADQTVIAKPQVVATVFKSNKDIKTYVTKKGDTVSKLAAEFHVTSDSIRGSNGLTGDQLAAGHTLYIPPFNGIVYVVKGGDTPDKLAQKFNANKDQIIAFNDAEIGGLKVGSRIVIPNGVISTYSNVRNTNTGYASFAPTYGAQGVYNGYDYGWCTWYVAKRRTEIGRTLPSNLGNAYSWYYLAQRAGLPTGLSPRVGAAVVNLAGNHVSIVERIDANGFWVSEMNSHGQKSISDTTSWGGWGVVDYKHITSGSFGFIY